MYSLDIKRNHRRTTIIWKWLFQTMFTLSTVTWQRVENECKKVLSRISGKWYPYYETYSRNYGWCAVLCCFLSITKTKTASFNKCPSECNCGAHCSLSSEYPGRQGRPLIIKFDRSTMETANSGTHQRRTRRQNQHLATLQWHKNARLIT